MFGRTSLLRRINKKLDMISLNMEKFKMIDYVHYLENPRKMFLANFIGGLARGVGIAIGFTLLGAVILYLLQLIVKLNLPVIGHFIADIVKIVQDYMQKTGGRVSG